MKTRKIIIYGIGILLTLFLIKIYTENPFVNNDNLYKLTVTAKENVKTTSGRYTTYGYSFLAMEYPSKFTIDNCINFVSDRNSIKEIKIGDRLEIMIEKYYQGNFANIKTEIPVFSLSVNNNEIFSPEKYLLGQTKQNYRRIAILSILIFALILLNQKKIRPTISWTVLIAYTIVLIILIERKVL